MSVKQKPKVKCLGEKKRNALKDLESGLPNKEVVKKYGRLHDIFFSSIGLKLITACFSVH